MAAGLLYREKTIRRTSHKRGYTGIPNPCHACRYTDKRAQARSDGRAARFRLKVIDETHPLHKIDTRRAQEYPVHLLIANRPLPAGTGLKTFNTIFDNQHEVNLEMCEQTGSTPKSPDTTPGSASETM